MVGVRRRSGMKTENVPGIALVVHDRAPYIAAAGPCSAGLHEENGLDVRLQRIARQAIEHGFARVPETRRAGTVIEGQQKADGRLSA